MRIPRALKPITSYQRITQANWVKPRKHVRKVFGYKRRSFKKLLK